MNSLPVALTIAGSDSSAGAGIQADLKTFMALNVYGVSAITSITAQNTTGINEIYDLPGFLVYKQIKSIADDIKIDAVKTGMLSNAEIIDNVALAIKDFHLDKLIVDPVLHSKDNSELLKRNSLNDFKEKILPLALVITPNISEAQLLSGIEISTKDDMIKVAEKLIKLGPEYIVIKGGHLLINEKVFDLIFSENTIEFLEYPRINTINTHGIGCTFSAAITAFIAKGYDVISSIKNARNYIQSALQNEIKIGKGFGPLNHRWLWKE